jgi:type IV pilus assembly protein PilF
MRLGLLFMLSTFIWGCAAQSNIQQNHSADARIALGLAYLEQGNLTKARDNLFKAQIYAPTYLPTMLSLAHYYTLVNNLEKSESIYQQALSLYTQDADLFNNYGVFLCKQHRFEEADHYLTQATSISGYSKIAESFENAALCSLANKEAEKAQHYLLLGRAYAPHNIKILAELTKIDLELGDTKQAQLHLQQLKMLTGDSPILISLGTKLEQQLRN